MPKWRAQFCFEFFCICHIKPSAICQFGFANKISIIISLAHFVKYLSMYNCLQTPRYYTVTDSTNPRSAEQQYSYSYQSSTVRDSNNPYSRPERTTYSSTTERRSNTGPGGYNYNTTRTSTTGSRPGDYSYSSTTSGRLPYGTTYRHYSYRV